MHGHIAILNKKCAVVAIVNNQNIQFTLEVLNKINKEYNTDSLILSAFPLPNIVNNDLIYIQSSVDIDFLFSTLVIFQLLAFETASFLKRNVDKPDGLEKVVK